MHLQDILAAKGSGVRTIAPDASVEEVVQELVRHNVGSLVVCERGVDGRERMVGIVTERDILRCVAAHRIECGKMRVSDIMTRKVITGSLGDDVGKIMGLMTNNRIRHLPIVDGDRLEGMISIGDVVKAQHDEIMLENHYLKNYIQS